MRIIKSKDLNDIEGEGDDLVGILVANSKKGQQLDRPEEYK